MKMLSHKGVRIKSIGFLFLVGIVILTYLFSSFGLALLAGIVGFSIGLAVKYGIRKEKDEE